MNEIILLPPISYYAFVSKRIKSEVRLASRWILRTLNRSYLLSPSYFGMTAASALWSAEGVEIKK